MSETLTIRLRPDVAKALAAATSIGPYRLTKTAVVERGIELALEEIERAQSAMIASPPSERDR